jgi:hypothetical protein
VGSACFFRFSLFFVFLSWVGLAWASNRIVVADFSRGMDKKGVPSGWEVKEKAGKADFTVIQEANVHALRLRSEGTSFSLQKQVDVDPRHFPLLTWKWKVTKLPEGGDVRKPHTDDQAAQLFVAFSNSKVIAYIWDTNAPQGVVEGTWLPPFLTIKALVVRSGYCEAGKWLTENRNTYRDYVDLYREEPPKVAGVRIQINSQHTDTSGESYFADVVFKNQ